jgi:ankyrin repeat protein
MGAAANGHLLVTRLLVDKGANLEAADKSGRSALNYAVLANHPEIAEVIRSGPVRKP